jgi:hypothetical protein
MRPILYLLAALGAGATSLSFVSGGPLYVSWHVCGLCGQIRTTREWQVPLTDLTLWTEAREESTPGARLLREAGYAHPHEWAFGGGAGNGVF